MDQEQNHCNIPNCQNFAEGELTTQPVELIRLRSDVSVQTIFSLHRRELLTYYGMRQKYCCDLFN